MRREIRLETFLANLPLFRGLGEAELQRLAAGTTRRKLTRGEALFREGEPPTGIHAVVFGQVRLWARGEGAREHTVDLKGPGDAFGEAVMFLEKPYIVSATAQADSLVLHVAKDVVFAELAENPRFAARIIGLLAQRVEGLMHELRSYALGSASRRFVAWLLRRDEVSAGAASASLTLPSAKRVLASRLNLSPEHLSRILHDLASEGLVVVRGRRLTIPDVARLQAWQRDAA